MADGRAGQNSGSGSTGARVTGLQHVYASSGVEPPCAFPSGGYVAVVLNADQLEAAVGQVRLFLVIVFVAAALMTLLVRRRAGRPDHPSPG